MRTDIHTEIYSVILDDHPARNEMTQRAFRMLPPLRHPMVLDVGCGRGGPTAELARLTCGSVVGLELDHAALQAFGARVVGTSVGERVRRVCGSMSAMAFRDGAFDLVWAEGSIFHTGFRDGLVAWRRLIRPGGYLVVQEMGWLQPGEPPPECRAWQRRFPGLMSVGAYLQQVEPSGYRLLGYFKLPESFWWEALYEPVQARIEELKRKYVGDSAALAVLDAQQREGELMWRCQTWYGSAFFVMQKTAA